jgi:hypothetical protein
MSPVEASGGKSPRKDDEVTRDVLIQLYRSAANGPMMDWSESLIPSIS